MYIKKIIAKNFKSFDRVEVNLDKLNIFIGANASGKSNLVQIFKFLLDISRNGLEDAISMQGGFEYLLNSNIGVEKELSIELHYNIDKVIEYNDNNKQSSKGRLHLYELIYYLNIKFIESSEKYEIKKDLSKIKFDLYRGNKISSKNKIDNGILRIEHKKNKIKTKVEDLNTPIDLKKLLQYTPFTLIEKFKLPHGFVLLGSWFINPTDFDNKIMNLSVYDFDPKLSKEGAPFTGKSRLESSGRNLAIVLKEIVKNKVKKAKLFNLIKTLLPFVDEVEVDKFADKFVFVKLKEKYNSKFYLPASLLSDGTINITALIVALYFEDNSILVIEEPEKNIHPQLLSKVIAMIKDVSKKKQIIITTHSPEFLKNFSLENIHFVSRDEDGFSKVYKTSNSKIVRALLKEDLGIDELFAKNLISFNKK